MALAAQSSSQAQAASYRDSSVLPSINEQMRAAQEMILPMLQRSIKSQEAYEQAAEDQWDRLQAQLAPREYSFSDALASLARGAGGRTVGETLAGMGAAAVSGREAFDQREIAKAEYLQKMAQTRADTNEKRVFDLFGKMQKLGQQAKIGRAHV